MASQVGTWAQSIAMGWLVLELSDDSGLAVGTVTALIALPTLVLGMWGGVAADRWDKRKLLLGAQVIQGLASAVLAVLVVTDVVQLWMVFALAFVSGMAQVVDNPTRNAFVPELVDDGDLANAIGLNGAIAQTARIVGPAIAGALIVWVGTGICFALDAVSFLAVIAALWPCGRRSSTATPPPLGPRPDPAGLRYTWRTFDLRSGLLIMVVLGTFGLNWGVVFPLLAKVTFGTNAAGFSLMTTAMSIGAARREPDRRPPGAAQCDRGGVGRHRHGGGGVRRRPRADRGGVPAPAPAGRGRDARPHGRDERLPAVPRRAGDAGSGDGALLDDGVRPAARSADPSPAGSARSSGRGPPSPSAASARSWPASCSVCPCCATSPTRSRRRGASR